MHLQPPLCSIQCLGVKKNCWVWIDVWRAILQGKAVSPLKNTRHPGQKQSCASCYALSDSSFSTDDKDDELPQRDNMNHGKAKEELDEFEHWKRKKYKPKVREMTARCLFGELSEVMVGPVEEEKNLPLGHNLFEYIDIQGRMDVVQFFSDHSKVF